MQNKLHQWYLEHTVTPPFIWSPNRFTAEECALITSLAQKEPQLQAKVNNGELKDEIRRNTLRWMNSADPEHEWIFRRLTDVIMDLNQQFYKFDLQYIEILQYTEYHSLGDFYSDHMDMSFNSIHRRKLSFSLQLSNPDDYDGSELEMVYGQGRYEAAPKTQGTIVIFPSYQMHRVTPLTRGQRNSLVGWVAGPQWK